MRPWRVLAGLGLAALAVGARAAPAPVTVCQITHGVLVVPARAAGLTGAFILDTGTARSVLDATQATLAGLGDPTASVPVRVAGVRLRNLTITIAPLDARTRGLPTPITGVLGADILAGRVLEVWPEPCRFRLTKRVAPVPALAVLPVVQRGGLPYVVAGVSDGQRAERGLFRVSTGADLAGRLGPDVARLEGAPTGAKDVTAPLRALSLGGLLIENPIAGIAADAEPGVAGEIGEPVWARQGFQLDLRRGRLVLFDPATKKARRSRSAGP